MPATITETYLSRIDQTTSTTHAFSSVTAAAGKLLIVRGCLNSDTITPSSTTDSVGGNTWTTAFVQNSSAIGGATSVFFTYSVLTNAISAGTVTVTLSATGTMGGDLAYFTSSSGWQSNATIVDRTAGGTFNLPGTPFPYTSGLTTKLTQANELLVGAAAHGNNNGSSSTPDPFWREEADANCANTGATWFTTAWRDVNLVDQFAFSGRWGAARFGCVAVVGFKPVAVADTAPVGINMNPYSLPDSAIWKG